MSVGIYIASYQKLTQTPVSSDSELFSLNELCRLDNFEEIVSDLENNLGINVKNVDPDEKMSVLLNDLDETFSVKRENEESTINRYTNRPFIYYVDVYDWGNFYGPFSEYLQSINGSFELWEIEEDKVELKDLRTIKLVSLDSQSLERILDLNDYLNPIVGIYE